MIVTIEESGMIFGPFEQSEVYNIEKSESYNKLGEGIKSVEFIHLKENKGLLFVEAKTTCPNPSNQYNTEDMNRKYEEYFDDISNKFVDSFNIFLTMYSKRMDKDVSFGGSLTDINEFKEIPIKFVLVVRKADEMWLQGPKMEFEKRLIKYRKIWKIDIVVLNDVLARKQGLCK